MKQPPPPPKKRPEMSKTTTTKNTKIARPPPPPSRWQTAAQSAVPITMIACFIMMWHFVRVPVMLSYPTTWVLAQSSTVPPNQPDSHVEFIPGTCQEISDILSGCCLWCYPIRQLGFHHSAALFLLTNRNVMWNLFRGLVDSLMHILSRCLWCYPIRQLGFHHSAALFLLTNQTLMWNLFRALVKRLVTFCPGAACDVILSNSLGSTTAQHCSS